MPFLVGYVTPQDYGAAGDGVTDDTAAIQAALNAVSANGSTVFFPAASYLITGTISITVTGTQIVGSGWGSQILYNGSSVTTALNASTNLRAFIRDIRISQTNASHLGTAINASNLSSSTIERVLIDAGSTGAAPLVGITMNASTCHYNEIRACRVNYGGTGGIGINIIGNSHSNTVIDCRIIPSGDTSTSAGIYVANTHSTTLIHPDVEQSAGSAIWLDTAAHGTTIINAYADLNNIGLRVTSGVVAPTVIGGTFQASTTANVQNNGAVNPLFQNLWPNSGTTTFNHLEFGNTDRYLINGVPVPGNDSHPSDQNLVAWSFDPAAASSSTVISSAGALHLVKVNLRYSSTITNVLYEVNTAGATLSSAFVGVYSSAGSLLATSASQTANFTATGFYTAAMTVPITNAAAGTYWVAFVCTGTTGPGLARSNNLVSAGAMLNAGLTAANYRFAVNGTGNATLPASITPASNTQDVAGYWAALS